jgi:hypothetical protein
MLKRIRIGLLLTLALLCLALVTLQAQQLNTEAMRWRYIGRSATAPLQSSACRVSLTSTMRVRLRVVSSKPRTVALLDAIFDSQPVFFNRLTRGGAF